MKLLKTALFTFICSIVILVTIGITNLGILYIPFALSLLICFGALVAWICTKIFNKFKHSLNVIMIFIFLILSIVSSFLKDEFVVLDTWNDILNISVGSAVWILSVLSCVVSILILIARIIFTSDKNADVKHEMETIRNIFNDEDDNR